MGLFEKNLNVLLPLLEEKEFLRLLLLIIIFNYTLIPMYLELWGKWGIFSSSRPFYLSSSGFYK